MIGIALGLGFGSLQLYLLCLGVGAVAEGRVRVWPMAVQFLCPFAGLLLCALLTHSKSQLLLCAGVICAILLVGALLRFFASRKKQRHKGKPHKPAANGAAECQEGKRDESCM